MLNIKEKQKFVDELTKVFNLDPKNQIKKIELDENGLYRRYVFATIEYQDGTVRCEKILDASYQAIYRSLGNIIWND